MNAYQLGDRVAKSYDRAQVGTVHYRALVMNAKTDDVVRGVYGVIWDNGDHGLVRWNVLVPAVDHVELQAAVDALLTPDDQDFLLDAHIQW